MGPMRDNIPCKVTTEHSAFSDGRASYHCKYISNLDSNRTCLDLCKTDGKYSSLSNYTNVMDSSNRECVVTDQIEVSQKESLE